jgi:hypothetical protein
MARKSRQFDRWREQLAPGTLPPRVRPKVIAATVGAVCAAGALAGALVLAMPWLMASLKPEPEPPVAFQFFDPDLGLIEGPQMTIAASAIDTTRVQRVVGNFILEAQARPERLNLYSSARPVPGGGMVRLADLDCRGSRPFAPPPLVEDPRRYPFMIEAIPFEEGVDAKRARFFAQPNFQDFEHRDAPLPVWIESPSHGEVVDSPFYVEGQAYESGFLQLRVRPKRWKTYYLKGQERMGGEIAFVRVEEGQEFKLRVREGSWEAFELYALFAKDRANLPTSEAIDSLPRGTGRVDIVGPVDFFVSPLRGPVRSEEELRRELDLMRIVSARFTTPLLTEERIPEVTLRYLVSGEVSGEAATLGLDYVLGVRPIYPVRQDPDDATRFVSVKPSDQPTHHVWIQSSPWATENGRFANKPVKFGVGHEKEPWEFELWLIAIRPEAKVRLEEGQAWLASALPEGCIRVASVSVVKMPQPERTPDAESQVQARTPLEAILPSIQRASQQRIQGYQRSDRRELHAWPSEIRERHQL